MWTLCFGKIASMKGIGYKPTMVCVAQDLPNRCLTDSVSAEAEDRCPGWVVTQALPQTLTAGKGSRLITVLNQIEGHHGRHDFILLVYHFTKGEQNAAIWLGS